MNRTTQWYIILLFALVGTIGLLPNRALAVDDRPCDPLPLTGNLIEVTPAQTGQLRAMVANASSGDTFLLHDGAYNLNGDYIWIDTPGITIRSYSGNREAVIIDGNDNTTEIITIAASDVTLADITLTRAHTHPIHVTSTANGDTNNTLIYNVHIIDPREQAIKINPGAAGYYPDNGTIACSHIELTDTGRPNVNPTSGGCYTGGVDAHQARGWTIRDNLIEGFWCATGLSEHAIHLWRGCRDTIVERNVLRNNARGVGFGLATSGEARTYPDNPCPSADGGYVDHYGGVIRNNFVFVNDSTLLGTDDGFDCGICLWQACEAQVLHNTVASTSAPTSSSIEWRFEHTLVTLTNNLVTHALVDRGGTAIRDSNMEGAALSLFADGPNGDLHLTSDATDAINQGTSIAAGLCDDDIDGDARPLGPQRDIGADEYGEPAPDAVTDLRVTHAVTASGTLTATLHWTPPNDAVTTTLQYAATPITENNWGSATVLTDSHTGRNGIFTASVPYAGNTRYFALKTQNLSGAWSGLSNNAFWPMVNIYLPLILRQ